MFNQNNEEEKKLDWMYKGPNSTVNREEYLLGRSVDKTLEQLNEEEKQKQQNLIAAPKNRVEHECIPPSIRDFNKLVQAEQVDLSTKLQEDPLVAIKKREEESRRQFLQNPVQLKKLQKALKAQQAKKKKKKKKSKHSSDSESDLEAKLKEKLLGQRNKKDSKEEKQLDTILIHKFEALKDKLTESDLQEIISGTFSDTGESSEDEKHRKKSKKKKRDSSDESDDHIRKQKHKKITEKKELLKRKEDKRLNSSSSSKRSKYQKRKVQKNESDREYKRENYKYRNRSRSPRQKSSSDSEREPETSNYHSKRSDSDDSSSSKNKRLNYGLVSSDGKKIALSRKNNHNEKDLKTQPTKAPEPVPVQKRRAHKLTEEEKEKLRLEMMENAVWRDKERTHNVKKYREREAKERKEENFDPDFIHKQLLKSANTSSVESRIKANLNNIQRSSRDMDKHFSRR